MISASAGSHWMDEDGTSRTRRGVRIRSAPRAAADSCSRNGDGVVSLDKPGEGIR
jgi:hypothetical protein